MLSPVTPVVSLCLAALLAASGASRVVQDAPLISDVVRLLGVKADEAHVVPAVWNDRRTIFVDYLTGPSEEPDRPLYAVQDQGGFLRATRVTVGEQEGGAADITAIGFANADRDPAKELVVIVTWDTHIYDVWGTFYEVRLFDDLKDGQTGLKPLSRLTRHFGSECDCDWRDGTKKRYRFKTIAAVRRELDRLGY